MHDLLQALGDEWSLTPPWTPIYFPSDEHRGDHKAWLAAARCRDCGGKVKHDRGGGGREGAWFLCHYCGLVIDLPLWGWRDDPQTGFTLEVLLEMQQARRRRYEAVPA